MRVSGKNSRPRVGKDVEKPSCPLCEKKETVLRYTLRDKRIFWCRACRSFFVDPFPDPTTLQASYDSSASEFQSKYFESFQDLRSKSFARGLQVLSALGRRGTLLDVGTGLGFFLTQARRAGWEAEGLELSDKMARYARQTLQLPVQVGTVEEASFANAPYAVVTLWDVLEHLTHPRGTLLRIRALLAEGGVTVIRTPVCDSLIPRILDLLYRMSFGKLRFGFEKLFKEHLVHFSEEGLRRLVEGCGFRILQAYREDYIDAQALRYKEWAQNPLVRLGARGVITLARLFHCQDEVVLYAESAHVG